MCDQRYISGQDVAVLVVLPSLSLLSCISNCYWLVSWLFKESKERAIWIPSLFLKAFSAIEPASASGSNSLLFCVTD